MGTNWKKLTAMGCSILYIILYLFLPVLSFKLFGIGVKGIAGADLLSETVWSWLPLLAGIAMAVCSMVLPSVPAGIVCGAGAFMPLFAYFMLKRMIVSNASFSGTSGLDSLLSMGTEALLSMGVGVILPILLGIGAAVLCFLSELGGRPKERTAGFSAGADDDW